MGEEEEKGLGFKVEDKRRFDSTGESRGDDDAGDVGGQAEQEADTATASEGATAAEAGGEEYAREGAELTFSSFVIGLASQAFMFLGVAPDSQSGVVHQDLPQAKAMIDILGMLEEKTAGNLDEGEAQMMEEMLYELRLHYVKAVKGGGSPSQEDTQ